MSNNINYKDQIKQLESIIDKINSLSINKKELKVIEDLVRNLYERIIIIKHNLEEPYFSSVEGDKESSQKLDSEEQGDFQDEIIKSKEIFIDTIEHIDNSVNASFNGLRLDTLVGSFGLNQKMRYINDLFNGSSDLFSDAIKNIDSKSTLEESKKVISSLSLKYNWDLESTIVIEFIDFVNRKYA